MNARWTSRKFLLTLAAQITAMMVLIWPQRGSEITEAAQTITGLLVMMLTALGYVRTEGAIDQEDRKSP